MTDSSGVSKTKEKQYQSLIDLQELIGSAKLGMMANQVWHDDPKRLAFVLSRYKFVAKMLSGRKNVLEIGCADGFGSRIVRQEVENLTAIDFDPIFISSARQTNSDKWPIEFQVHDMLDSSPAGTYDAIFCVDVLEHIAPSDEAAFIGNAIESLLDEGVMIVGIPTLESQAFASPISREGHVNCKSSPDLKNCLEQYFHNVFMFSMNDEVIHTGFHSMAHYIFAICCQKKV
jgi:2-polyprenyl-3-methyl-5-hydroxy-6-metoxy-1,4-benzoquinol methylase